MWTIPCCRVGNLLVVFAERKIYSSRPWIQAAALNAVSRNEELREYRGHLKYNLAVIKSVFCVEWTLVCWYSRMTWLVEAVRIRAPLARDLIAGSILQSV